MLGVYIAKIGIYHYTENVILCHKHEYTAGNFKFKAVTNYF